MLSVLTFEGIFSAGASYYGICDLEALARDTHKFESRYLDRLIGAYPEEKSLYIARSPIHSVDRVSCPVILFQGGQDRVVPPNQAEAFVSSLQSQHIPVAYFLYASEGHGFVDAENVKKSLEEELSFFASIFTFTPYASSSH